MMPWTSPRAYPAPTFPKGELKGDFVRVRACLGHLIIRASDLSRFTERDHTFIGMPYEG